MALFANASREGLTNLSHLVEFKAGRSTLEPGSTPEKRKVVSDKTKGFVIIKQSSDQLLHFIWKNRETNTIVDDLIIFPGDTEFLKVKECTDGRVFMLKFKSNNERRLFWMQDNKADKDDVLVKTVNDILNRPPNTRAGGRGGTAERAGGLRASLSALGSGGEGMGALSSFSENELMELLQLMHTTGTSGSSADALVSSTIGGSTDETAGTPATGAAGAGTGKVKLSDLQSILSQMDGKKTEGGAAVAGTSRGPQPSLTDVFKSSNVIETVKANEERLIPHLPSEAPIKADRDELNMTILTPQFQQAASFFGAAFQTGQMGPVLEQFGCSENVRAAAATGDLLLFAKKLTEDERGEPFQEERAKPKEEPAADVEMTPAEVDAQINREAEAEETTESALKEPDAKRNKTTDDNMELD